MMYLLDTDVFTLAHRATHGLRTRIDTERATNDVAVSVVTRIEVMRGRFEAVLKASDAADLLRLQARLVESEAFLGEFEIVPFDAQAANHFARLLRDRSLKKIGRCDLLIACVALAHDATLVTATRRTFGTSPASGSRIG